MSALVIVGAVWARALLSSELPLLRRLVRAAAASALLLAGFFVVWYVIRRYLPELVRMPVDAESKRKGGRVSDAVPLGQRVDVTIGADRGEERGAAVGEDHGEDRGAAVGSSAPAAVDVDHGAAVGASAAALPEAGREEREAGRQAGAPNVSGVAGGSGAARGSGGAGAAGGSGDSGAVEIPADSLGRRVAQDVVQDTKRAADVLRDVALERAPPGV